MSQNDLDFTEYKRQQVSPDEIEKLETLLRANPDDLQIIDWVAFAQYCSGNHTRAVELYRICIEREPGTASYYYFLGNALYKLAKPDEAVVAWQTAADLDRTGKFRKKAQERLAAVKAGPSA